MGRRSRILGCSVAVIAVLVVGLVSSAPGQSPSPTPILTPPPQCQDTPPGRPCVTPMSGYPINAGASTAENFASVSVPAGISRAAYPPRTTIAKGRYFVTTIYPAGRPYKMSIYVSLAGGQYGKDYLATCRLSGPERVPTRCGP